MEFDLTTQSYVSNRHLQLPPCLTPTVIRVNILFFVFKDTPPANDEHEIGLGTKIGRN